MALIVEDSNSRFGQVQRVVEPSGVLPAERVCVRVRERPRHSPTVGSWVVVVSYERGTPVLKEASKLTLVEWTQTRVGFH